MTRVFISVAALFIFGFCFGDDIDRWCIAGLIVFAGLMAGGIPSGMHEGELDA